MGGLVDGTALMAADSQHMTPTFPKTVSLLPVQDEPPATVTPITNVGATDAAVTALEPKPEPIDFPLQTPKESSPVSQNRLGSDSDNISPPVNISGSTGNGVVSPNPGKLVTANKTPDHHAALWTPEQSKPRRRSGDLFRVNQLGSDDRIRYCKGVRQTRMLYDGLRTLLVVEEGKQKRQGTRLGGTRTRADLKAGCVMRNRGLWLNCEKRIVGAIPGIEIGDVFIYRMELCILGLHGQIQSGIDYVPASQSASKEPIATSVIVSGNYEDDEDTGDVIHYTGQGGQDRHYRQISNQKLERGNLALERSMAYGIEVRVIRGMKYDGSITGKVYVYDGLYKILDCRLHTGKSSFGVYKFKLLRMAGQTEMGSVMLRHAMRRKLLPLLEMPTSYISLDISNKKENVQVLLYNDIDDNRDPLSYSYISTTLFPAFVCFSQGKSGHGCNCDSGCGYDGCLCALKNCGEIVYDDNGILLRGKPVIFECGSFCKCPTTCHNRVAQNGTKTRLEVFRLKEKGWGVRSLDLIQAGSFICEYAGVVLTMEQAKICSMNGDDKLVYPSRFAKSWSEWGDLSKVRSDYTPPSSRSIPPLDYAVDVTSMRSVGCHIRHSSTPNVMVQSVLYDHNNLMFPHLMIFAMENIPPLRELLLDYGVPDDERKPMLAIEH